MFRILTLYLDFEGAENIHVLQVLILDFGGLSRLIARVLYLDFDFEMVTGL